MHVCELKLHLHTLFWVPLLLIAHVFFTASVAEGLADTEWLRSNVVHPQAAMLGYAPMLVCLSRSCFMLTLSFFE
jgi:hypothetical protein